VDITLPYVRVRGREKEREREEEEEERGKTGGEEEGKKSFVYLRQCE